MIINCRCHGGDGSWKYSRRTVGVSRWEAEFGEGGLPVYFF